MLHCSMLPCSFVSSSAVCVSSQCHSREKAQTRLASGDAREPHGQSKLSQEGRRVGDMGGGTGIAVLYTGIIHMSCRPDLLYRAGSPLICRLVYRK